MNELGNKLKMLRERRGLSKSQLAHELGVTTPAVYHMESGIRKPSITMLVKLAIFFDVTIDELAILAASKNEVTHEPA